MLRRSPMAATLWLLLLVAAGCSGSNHPATSPVSGIVTYHDAPVEGALVIFAPQAGGQTATATTDAEGKFALSTFGEKDGAVPGSYKVTVAKTAKDETPPKTEAQLNEEYLQQMKTGRPPAPPQPPKNLLPVKYLSVQTTTLSATVNEGTNDEVRLELVD